MDQLDLAYQEHLKLEEAYAESATADLGQCFIDAFSNMQTRVHETAVSKGWWENPRNDGELLALIHSEVSETLEALRLGNPPDDKVPEFLGSEAELADVIIRIMDMAAARGWRVAEAIVAKNSMNKNRAYRHGKNF